MSTDYSVGCPRCKKLKTLGTRFAGQKELTFVFGDEDERGVGHFMLEHLEGSACAPADANPQEFYGGELLVDIDEAEIFEGFVDVDSLPPGET